MLTIYGCANTRSSRAVWALEEVGAEYEYVPVNLMAGAGRQWPGPGGSPTIWR